MVGDKLRIRERCGIPPKLAILLVYFCLGELGEGLNILEGLYLVGRGWNEGSAGAALGLVGLTALVVQPWAGDRVDNTHIDRRVFVAIAGALTAMSASAVLFVRAGNYVGDHFLIYGCKIIEGIAASYIFPCIAALTLATFGPSRFDAVMAAIMVWGHMGSVVVTALTGTAAYFFFPNVKYCFLVVAAAALLAIVFVPFVQQGNPLIGRGFKGKEVRMDEDGYQLKSEEMTPGDDEEIEVLACLTPEAATYLETFTSPRTALLCLTGFFYQYVPSFEISTWKFTMLITDLPCPHSISTLCRFADTNVVLVLGELMGHEDGTLRQAAIPLVAGAIVIAQLTMAYATHLGDWLTIRGIGRKPLMMFGLLTLPIRCALIVRWKNAGDTLLLSTQILDGFGGGLFGLVQSYIVADITFGTGRFNLVMGLSGSFIGYELWRRP